MKLLGHSYKIGNMGHPRTSKSKIANLMKLVNFAFFSSQGNIFELKNVKGNLIDLIPTDGAFSKKIHCSRMTKED